MSSHSHNFRNNAFCFKGDGGIKDNVSLYGTYDQNIKANNFLLGKQGQNIRLEMPVTSIDIVPNRVEYNVNALSVTDYNCV